MESFTLSGIANSLGYELFVTTELRLSNHTALDDISEHYATNK